ncbi:peptidase M61 [Acidovorax lacteus]|uniref:PDZ domain-containing protein n=1 Tax=Acidovorax lacteus TaxID=1924988 RepID=A0ABP8KXL6_9BURK
MARSTPRPPAVQYRIEAPDLHTHCYRVTLTVAEPAALQQVSLPVWIPGSYLVREFSRHLQRLTARQGRRNVAVTALGKQLWQTDCRAGQPLVLQYEVYAFDTSVRTAWLDATRGFFNGTSLCLRVHGCEDAPHQITVERSPAMQGWQLATGLAAEAVDAYGFGSYRATDYDELVDCPVEMGRFWSGEFRAGGVPHRLVVAGAAPSFDAQRLLADTQKICETVIRFWHPTGKPPMKRYVFLLNVVLDGYGGLEHRNSTALICGRRDLPRLDEPQRSDGYTTLLGLISHEYFHTWNVKRLRPAEFARYDYDRENYTRLLWFFEGFTSYYDDLLLRRAGLLDDAGYLKLLNKTMHQVLQAPGRHVQSVAEASFDAWIKYYRQDENTANATISYYTKGALVALCLDLALRREGRTTLDAVMRGLWARCQGGPMREDDLLAELAAHSGRSWAAEIAQWVHSTDELPLSELLAAHGVDMQPDRPQWAQRLGLRVAESQGVVVKQVLRGGPAERAGLAAGDEWLGVETPEGGWRLHKLDDLPLLTGRAHACTALVARDGRLLRLPLQWPALPGTAPAAAGKAPRKAARPAPPATPDTVQLKPRDGAAVGRWLAG